MHLYYIRLNYNECWLTWSCVLFTNLKLSYHTDLSDFLMFIVSTKVTVWRRIELLHLFNVLVCICVPKLQSELVCFLSWSMLRLKSWNALNFSSGSLFTWIPEKKKEKKKYIFEKIMLDADSHCSQRGPQQIYIYQTASIKQTLLKALCINIMLSSLCQKETKNRNRFHVLQNDFLCQD